MILVVLSLLVTLGRRRSSRSPGSSTRPSAAGGPEHTATTPDTPARSDMPSLDDRHRRRLPAPRSTADRHRRRSRRDPPPSGDAVDDGVCLLTYVALAVVAFLPTAPSERGRSRRPAAGNPGRLGPVPDVLVPRLAPVTRSPTASTSSTRPGSTTPTGVNLADNTTVPLLSFIAWPITANLGPIAAFNFLLRWRSPSRASHVRRLAPLVHIPHRPVRRRAALRVRPLHDRPGAPPRSRLRAHPSAARCGAPTSSSAPSRCGRGVSGSSSASHGGAVAHLARCPQRLHVARSSSRGRGPPRRHRRRLRERSRTSPAASGVAAVVTFALLSGYLIWYMIAGPNHLTGAVIPTSALQGLHSDLRRDARADESTSCWRPSFDRPISGTVGGRQPVRERLLSRAAPRRHPRLIFMFRRLQGIRSCEPSPGWPSVVRPLARARR